MRSIYVLVILFFSITTQAQLKINIPEKLPKSPPGTIKVNDSLYVDKHPITIGMYVEMLEHIKEYWYSDLFEKSSEFSIEELQKIKFDTTLRKKLFFILLASDWIYGSKMWKSDSEIASFFITSLNHPITTISEEQATFYCKWRTNILYLTQKNDSRYYNQTNRIYNYRLVGQQELIDIEDFFDMTRKIKFLKKRPSNYTFTEFINLWKKNKYLKYFEKDNGFISQNTFRCVCEIN